MQNFSDLSFSVKRFLPLPVHRIIELLYPEKFTLTQFIESQREINLLLKHALQHENILGFIRLMPEQVWFRSDVFAKEHFYQKNNEIWLDGLPQPLFEYRRDVNWLFKQDKLVVDWIAESIQHTSVRVTITALSFIDCREFHPNIILSALQYFQFASARMFIFSCAYYATKEKWSNENQFKHLSFLNDPSSTNSTRVVTPSILYVDEWLELLAYKAKSNEQIIQQVYTNLSRVMRSFMQYLHEVTVNVPKELMDYIQPDQQKGRDFIYVLKRNNIQLDEFRQLFYLRDRHVRESVFDAYVRDYLMHYFSENPIIPKNIRWKSLFHKAVGWHHEIQKKDLIDKLKDQYQAMTWKAFSSRKIIEFNHWNFEELSTIDRIVQESQYLHHCLASAYTEQIIAGEYVAFHMSSSKYEQNLTLGCHHRSGKLVFDQLEHSNNKKAEQVLVTIAMQFIDWFNQNMMA